MIRNIFVVRVELKEEIKDCSLRRISPEEIVYNIILREKKVIPKEAETKAKPKEKEKKVKTEETNKEEAKEPDDTKHDDFAKEKKKWALDIIVLDPGHGGKDAGAISVNGYKEKDFTLEIGLKVRDLIEENLPHTKVVMTRSDDRFIELYRRGQLANQSHGKLFISIHLNSVPKKPGTANGFETYILRPGRNDDAVRVANFENAAVKFEKKTEQYKNLTDEEIIISTMAQSSFVKFSDLFAGILQSEVSKTTPLQDRGVNQAGFYVLVGASMPNVLCEVAFLSNISDEEYVNTKKGINNIAKGIFNAIKRYSIEYEKICH